MDWRVIPVCIKRKKKTLSRPVPGTFGGKSLLTRKRGSDGTQSLRIHSSSSYCTRWMPSFWLAWKPPGAARSRLLPPDLDHVLTALARAGAWHCAGRRHPNRALHISSYTWATFFFSLPVEHPIYSCAGVIKGYRSQTDRSSVAPHCAWLGFEISREHSRNSKPLLRKPALDFVRAMALFVCLIYQPRSE